MTWHETERAEMRATRTGKGGQEHGQSEENILGFASPRSASPSRDPRAVPIDFEVGQAMIMIKVIVDISFLSFWTCTERDIF